MRDTLDTLLCLTAARKANGGENTMERGEILRRAHEIVTGERQNQYGKAEDSFALIAGLWSAFLDVDLTPRDVALMMILLKAAREKGGLGKADNWIDIAGYAACGGEICTECTGDAESQIDENYRQLIREIFRKHTEGEDNGS